MTEQRELLFATRQDWRKWLELNHDKCDGIWMVYYKKSSGKESVSYNDSVEEALCFGWIDSIIKSVDSEKYKQKYTPRRKKSIWSKLNKERVDKMISQGKMTVFGLAKIEEAKANGQWDKAYSIKENLEMPDDLVVELLKNETAWQNFQNFSESNQNLYIRWLNNAKRQETREKRLKEIVNRAFINQKPGII